jgi:lipopolysaccharide biosynthesis protein
MTGGTARAIAYYLPQYHPIPENDAWWGRGFTEWTNAARAKPLFRGHYQPHVPADLGFYDLRAPESRAAQAELARAYGVEAFCYYHYWFAGRQLLERPLREVLALGEPDFPFCVNWANESWTGVWHGAPNRVLIEQRYPGVDDHRAHFAALLPAFRDPRYVRVEGKPLVLIYRPLNIPEVSNVMDLWRELAHRAGLNGLYVVGNHGVPGWEAEAHGLDASSTLRFPERRPWVSRRSPIRWAKRMLDERAGRPTVYRYEDVCHTMWPVAARRPNDYPCLVPNWDNTPRSGRRGLVFHGSTPELFRAQVRHTLDLVRDRPPERNLVFIKSWNEWAEGNHLEPDLKFGLGYLEVLRDELRC